MFRGGGLGLQELWITVHHIVDHLCACGGTSITVHNMHTFACTPWQHAFICLASLYVQYQAPNRFSELKYIHACTNVNLKNSWSATLSLSSGCTPLEVLHADAYCCTSGMVEISGGRPDPPPLYLESHELLSGGLLGAPFLKRGELQQRCRAVGHPPCNWPGNGGGVDVLILIRAGTVSKVHVLFLRVIVAAVGAAVICRSH